jgi:hypothetical protein
MQSGGRDMRPGRVRRLESHRQGISKTKANTSRLTAQGCFSSLLVWEFGMHSYRDGPARGRVVVWWMKPWRSCRNKERRFAVENNIKVECDVKK